MWTSVLAPAFQLLGWISQAEEQTDHSSSSVIVQISYTGPIADGGYAWEHAFERADEAVKQMTLDEKV